jgi:hypothetical protein
MRIPLTILGGLAGYIVWSSSFAGVTSQLVSALSF